jgi:hemolysin activation/secretion protein
VVTSWVRLGRSRLSRTLGILVLILFAFEGRAQQDLRPADRLPEPPEFETESDSPPIELPPLTGDETEATSATLIIMVKAIIVSGHTVLSAAEIERIIAPYRERWIGSADLLDLTRALTRLYVSQGYVTSKVILPDQDFEDDVLHIEAVEGQLAAINIEGNRTFRDVYFRTRLERAGRQPLNVLELADQIELFQRDPRIERIDAVLKPTERAGISTLEIRLVERSPWAASLRADNYHTPSVGSYGGGIAFAQANVLGFGDEISIDTSFTEGLVDVEPRFSTPLWAGDTELSLAYRYAESEVVEEPFSDLDIEGEIHSVSLELSHPVYRSRSVSFWAGAIAEWRKARSKLLGRSFCFQARVLDCTPTVSVLRAFQELRWRGRATALVARSTFNLGVKALGATQATGSSRPDGQFFSWLGQIQWVQLPPISESWPSWLRETQFALSTVIQLTDDPLLSLEQIAIGGPETIRGYRKNLIVRDNGVFASGEIRIPILRDAFGRHRVEFGPFVDIGRGWDSRDSTISETIASVGLGLRVFPTESLRAEFHWGYRLMDQEHQRDPLQENGFNFRVVWNVF